MMTSFRRRVFLSGIILLTLCVFSENSETEVDSILEEIQKEYKNFEIGEQKKIILVLGNTGSGKSTITLLLTGAELVSKRIAPGTFIIEDDNDLISGKSTTVSKTKVPNLMIDKETNTTFYDCPGFADSRGVVIDITATRSIHDLLNFANEIKLLFVESYDSINVIGDRKKFLELAEHSTNLIKNIEKYGKGMALVVTKVRDLFDYNEKNEAILLNDEIMIEIVADFINQTKSDLKNNRANKLTFEERRLNEEKIKFCEIFLERESNEYTRIKIVRMVSKPGPLKNMESTQNEKEAIKTMINYYIEYVPTNITDFHYSISDASKGHVIDLITKLEDKLEKYSGNICTDLKSFYNKDKPMIKSIKRGINFFQLPSNREFIKHFNQLVVSLGIEINADILKNISKSVDFLDFLQIISNLQSISISKQMEGKLKLCATELLDEVKTRLRIDVPNAILQIQENYFAREKSDLHLLNKLKTFLSVGLTYEVNSTVLRSLLNLTSDKHFSRNMEFFDFLQLLNDKDRVLSVNMLKELEVCANGTQQQTKSRFSDDVRNIFDAIKAFHVQKEKQNYLNLEDIKMTTSMIRKKLSTINIKSAETLVKDLIDVVNDFGLIGNNAKILRKLEFLQEKSSIYEKIVKNLNACTKYLNDSQVWYSFLLSLRSHLLKYEVQQNSSLRNEGYTLMEQSINSEYGSRHSNEIGLKPILDSLNEKEFTDVIENITINVFKLKAIQAVWLRTMSNFTFSCSNNSLIVKGYVVSISNVVKLKCWPNVTVINIFGLNKIFFDADIDKIGKSVELSIISPLWEIVPSSTNIRRINMQGKHGIEMGTAKAGENGEPGKDGLPGKPGGPGGSFFGISSSFISDHQLLIDVSGGEGGGGEHGGRGGDGIEGETIKYRDFPSNIFRYAPKTITHRSCTCKLISNNFYNHINDGYDRYMKYVCYGKPGTRGGKGGDGGCGGFGGNSGNIFIVGLDEIPRVNISNKTGKTGIGGNGNFGGSETGNGRNLSIDVHKWNRFFSNGNIDLTFPTNDEPGIVVPAGDKGGYGINCKEIEKPSVTVAFRFAPLITAYQEYARENLVDNTLRSNLEHFVNGLTNNETLDSFFDITDLIEEFTSLEKQYFHLRKKYAFAPFYQSLKNRIERYVKRIGESDDKRKSVKSLYTAVISKLLSIKNQANQIATSNLLTYIDIIRVNIAKLKEDKRVEYITEYRDNYKSSLEKEMKSANELVQNMVVPAIDKEFSETENNIQELLNEAAVKHKETEEGLKTAEENKKKLKKSILWHNILAPFKLIGSLLSLTGPQGAIVGAVTSGGASFAESIIDGGLEPKKISTSVAPYKKLINKITNDFMRQQLLFSEQLCDLDKILSESNSTNFDEIRRVVKNVTIQMNETIKFDKNFVTNVTKEFEMGKKAIEDVLNVTQKHYNELKVKDKDVGDVLDRIGKMQTLLKVADVGIDIYKQNRNDNKKLDEINEQIENLQDQLNTWKQYEENIKAIMMPQLKEIQSSFEKSSKDLSGKSHVVLDISKWKMQGALGDLKKLFREMAKAQDSVLEGDLLHCIDKIGEGITTLITVYDRIDSYAEQSKLATLISDVAIGSSNIDDSTLKKAVLNLDKIVQTNLVLERFEVIMQALKQHKFPHARRYLKVFDKFPPGLQSNDTENVITTVTENIDSLRNELIISKSTLQILDINTFSNHSFSSIQPFYTWYYQDFKNDIQQLLNGARITLKSDISKGVKFTAVKFKEISINFKLTNEMRQKELNMQLEKFNIVMTMVGNNYYRCNNRIYYTSMDKNVVLIYHMRNGTIVGKNDIYQKISESDYFLSPYTVWNIQLTSKEYVSPRVSHIFDDFKDEIIDLQLIGIGQIINNEIENEFEICSSDLDNYYAFDGILT